MMKTSRSVLGMGALALIGTVMTAAAPHAAMAQAIRLNPELHNVRANLALMGDDAILYTSSADISGTTVGANDQVWITEKAFILPWQNNKPWGWRPMNPDLVNAASSHTGGGPVSSKLVLDIDDPNRNKRIYYRDDRAGDLGYLELQGNAWVQRVFAVTGSIKEGTYPCVALTGQVFYHEETSGRLFLCGPHTNEPGYMTSPTWAMHPGDAVSPPASPVRDHIEGWSIYARGHDNRLVITRYENQQFVATWPGDPVVYSDPAVNDANSVVFAGPGTRNPIHSMRKDNNGVWQTARWGTQNPTNPPASGKVTGAPTVGAHPGIVYYRGNNGALWSCHRNGGASSHVQVLNEQNCAGDILCNSAGVVFYRGTPDKYGNYSIWRKP